MTDNLDERLRRIGARADEAFREAHNLRPGSRTSILASQDVPWLIARLRDALAENERQAEMARSINCDLVEERAMLAARLAEVEKERDRFCAYSKEMTTAHRVAVQRADAAEAKLAAVEALISEAEAGAGIVITPGFTTYYSVDTGLLRAALDAEAVTDP